MKMPRASCLISTIHFYLENQFSFYYAGTAKKRNFIVSVEMVCQCRNIKYAFGHLISFTAAEIRSDARQKICLLEQPFFVLGISFIICVVLS